MHVLFLCPHGAAKSVIATAMLRDLARRQALEVTASNAGTEPDASINPIALDELRAQGLTFTEAPRLVTKEHIGQADIVVSLGCGLHELPTAPRRFVDWSDTPNASEDVNGLRQYLSSRLASLLE